MVLILLVFSPLIQGHHHGGRGLGVQTPLPTSLQDQFYNSSKSDEKMLGGGEGGGGELTLRS